MPSKIKNLTQLKKQRATWKRQKKTVVFTNGCFDIIHFGHVSYLRKAKAMGDVLVIALNTDASVRKNKGPSRPINSQKDRAEVLSEFVSVDSIIFFSDETPERLIRSLKPDVLVKGADWAIKDIAGASFVQGYGGSVRLIKFQAGRSSSNIIKKMKA